MKLLTTEKLLEKIFNFVQKYFNIPIQDYLKDISWNSIQNILTISSIALIISIILFATLWLLKSVALYTMAKNKDDKYAFLSFVPYGCLVVMGKIAGKNKIWGIEVEKTEYLLPLLLITTLLPFSEIISIILFVFFYYGILYRIYKEKWKQFAIVGTILSFFIPLLQPIFLFIIRKK